MLALNKQVNFQDIKVYYMEDDGGSTLTNGVDPEIKAAIQKVVRHLESTHDIVAKKVRMTYSYLSQYIFGSKLNFISQHSPCWYPTLLWYLYSSSCKFLVHSLYTSQYTV
jgi:hypothetical protein